MAEQPQTSEDVKPGEPLREPGVDPKKVVRRGVACVLVGGTFWGVNGALSGRLMSGYAIDPVWLVCVRMLLAGLLLCAVATLRDARSVPRVFDDGRLVAQMLATAFGGLMLNSIAYLSCINYTDAGTATIMQELLIPLTLAYVCLRNRRWPRRRELLGLALAMAGVVLICTHGDLGAIHIPPLGLFWGLVCAAGGCVAGIGNRRVLAERGTMPVMGVEMLLIGLGLSVFVRPWEHIPVLDATGVALFWFTITFGTVVAFGLYYAGVKMLGAYRAGLLGTIEPVTATLSSVLLLGVAFTPAELVGFALILAMVFLTS